MQNVGPPQANVVLRSPSIAVVRKIFACPRRCSDRVKNHSGSGFPREANLCASRPDVEYDSILLWPIEKRLSSGRRRGWRPGVVMSRATPRRRASCTGPCTYVCSKVEASRTSTQRGLSRPRRRRCHGREARRARDSSAAYSTCGNVQSVALFLPSTREETPAITTPTTTVRTMADVDTASSAPDGVWQLLVDVGD